MSNSCSFAIGTLETISKATTTVRTSLLERNGIQSLRILSETRFLELLRGAEESSRRALKGAAIPEGALAASGDEADAGEIDQRYREKWYELRTKHESSLSRIEGRMEKLSRAFQGIQGVFEKLETSNLPAGTAPCAQPLDVSKHKALLREMLLKGDAP